MIGFLCTEGSGSSSGLAVNRYLCPWCQGSGRWGDSGERCLQCAGSGVTDDASPGVDLTRSYTDVPADEVPESMPVPITRPPAVMRAPCTDCAFRPGSPEELGEQPVADAPFFCHHDLTRVADGYVAPAMYDGLPLGAMVCASWWAARVEGKGLPRVAFRDPGGSDRTAAAPAGLPL